MKEKVKWSDEKFREKFWHSSSHLLAAAVKQLYPDAKFGIGPAIEEGFYYDFDVKKPFTPEDLIKIEKKMNELAAKDEKFVKKELSKKEAAKLFAGQPYKLELISELPEASVSTYALGEFTDLCKGPHISSSGSIKAIKLLKVAGAYWRGSERNKMLQRIYGIAFPGEKMLNEHLNKLKEAEKRNHLVLGKQLDLFSIHNTAPGCVFIHPKGMVIWNELTKFWRAIHEKAGYVEVSTPIILKQELWKQSGHWQHYKDSMYFTKIDKEDFAVKPMNCPASILIYKSRRHSYKELPIRMSELGLVHRHEKSGVLNGLFRVRKFTQDDAHIYCMEEQVVEEVKKVIELVDEMYRVFGFSYAVELSTRPADRMGSDELWDRAEKSLKNALDDKKIKFKTNAGAGAFYGPKIDFHIRDSLGRTWQCATIQLDFSMPEKFDLMYVGADDKEHRPAMIHRTVYGSMERFMGILIEHYGGNFPAWLAPVQARVLMIADRHKRYAEQLIKMFREQGIRAELDDRSESIPYKVRDAQLSKIPYILAVGDMEQNDKTVAVRTQDGKLQRNVKFESFLKELVSKVKERK